MTATHGTDLGQTSSNAMLTAKASKAVTAIAATHQVVPRQAAVLVRAAELFGRIVEGSLFIENREEAGFAPSHVGLAEYERAISAARTLNLVSQDRDLTEMFVGYRSILISLSQGADVPQARVTEVKQFLSTLSDFFYSDLVRPFTENRADRFVFDG